jgi:hypothetical protein
MKDNKSNGVLLSAAIACREVGLCALPALHNDKRPALSQWKEYQTRLPKTDELTSWFANGCDAVCLVCGAVSGQLELIDFDRGAELFEAWSARIPDEIFARLVIETSQSGGRHVVYRCRDPVSGNLKLAQRQEESGIVTLIETRGDGGLFLCAPSPGYELVQGEFTSLPVLTAHERELLLLAAWELNEYWATTPQPAPCANLLQNPDNTRPGDDFNTRGDVVALLEQHGWQPCGVRADGNQHWTRPGKSSGTSATLKDRTFYVFSSNAHPFEPNAAYSPFAVSALLEHGGDYASAASALGHQGYGQLAATNNDVDISGIVCGGVSADEESTPVLADPGPIPEHLFDVPGFVNQVMEFTLANAPYPNVALAFCGAMALQSFLAARKVCTPGDLRTNIYLLALAGSGTGKDFPRKVNTNVLYQVGLANALGDKFASGEGIQDALVRTGAMLFQNDEMDGVLRQINLDQENRRESIPNILLTLYTSANDIYPIRVKAGQKEAIHVDQPHVTLFGTATPQYFYESLSQRMLTNGFFARMSIIDVGRRGAGQTPGSARKLPKSVLEVARWWAEYQPGTGNLQDFHPEPREVAFDADAAEAVEQLRSLTESEYDRAEEAKDEVSRTAWSRTCENAKKLSLIYACSANHEAPVIDLPAIEWATTFAMHQTRRQLYLAQIYVAENPFHADCLKLLRKLKAAGGQASRSEILRDLRCKAADLDQIVGTLIQQGDVVPVTIPSATKSAQGFRIA